MLHTVYMCATFSKTVRKLIDTAVAHCCWRAEGICLTLIPSCLLLLLLLLASAATLQTLF